MVLHLPSSSPYSLLYSSLHSSCSLRHKLQTLNCPHKRNIPSLHLKHFSHRTQVSVQETLLRETQSPATESPDSQSLDGGKISSSSKGYIWVNPKSPRASKLSQKSYDARYSSLVKIAESLNYCNSSDEEVYGVLRNGLGDVLLEQDAVIILNNMANARNAYLALKFFQGKLKLRRKVILYNVMMKVFRKCWDLDSAEKLFDEMLERAVMPDNITFSTIISCARMCSLPYQAVQWFEKMPEFGCDPDDVTYSAMIDAYGRAGNVLMALKYMIRQGLRNGGSML